KQKFFNGDFPTEYILDEGDLLVAMTEQAAGLLGSTLIVPSGGTFLHNQRLGLFQTEDSVQWDNKFFSHLFNTSQFREKVQESASGTKVRHTSPKKMYDISISFPKSRSEQIVLARRLTELRSHAEVARSIMQRKLDHL